MTRLGIVDYGAGNLVSIDQALRQVGAEPVPVAAPQDLEALDGLIVPGVGAAAPAMERLAGQGLIDPVLAWIGAGRPFLGICLGLQLLFEGSDEDGAATLDVLPGRTRLLDDAPTLPHIGWNQVELTRPHPLFDGIADGTDFYFVHSYVGSLPADRTDPVLGWTTHGGRFASAVARGGVHGVQFHPERSGRDGLRLLANFVAIAARGAVERPAAAERAKVAGRC